MKGWMGLCELSFTVLEPLGLRKAGLAVFSLDSPFRSFSGNYVFTSSEFYHIYHETAACWFQLR
jgi:hypothetical protein